MVVKRPLVTVTVALVLGLLAAPVAADYKPEFKTSIVVSEQTPWGQAANRFATAVRYRTQGRINIKKLKVRVVGIPIFVETFRALGANPVTMNLGEMLAALQQGTIDGQENPIALIVPYRFWSVHKYITLWHYAVDPVILAVSAKTWVSLSAEDRTIVRKIGEEVMAVQKKEAREGLEGAMTALDTLQRIYGMEGVHLSPGDVKAFRDKTRPVYTKWAEEIGADLVRSAETIVESAK